MNDKPVLLLNHSEEILNVISWQKAVMLLCAEKATAPYGHEEFYRIPTSRGYYDLPTAIVLSKYVRVPYKKATLSRRNLMKRDGSKCQYCGCKLNIDNETIDHVVPTSKGGKHRWENVVACCKPCNARKGDRSNEDIGYKLRQQPFAPTRSVLVQKIIAANQHSSWRRWLPVQTAVS